jgi:ribonuclease D
VTTAETSDRPDPSSAKELVTESATDAAETEPDVIPLLEPADGVPAVLTTPAEVDEAAAALAAGTGPVAIDAERASGYRYGQRAYLVQIKRAGAGSFLIDPVDLPDLGSIDAALADVEWVLHAASQDLPCLAELGMRPRSLFDTELAGRIAGKPRVGLGPLVESVLGLRLEKGHGAADWSTRPLPEPWLRYAALDVEVLVELRDALAADLRQQGKHEWAHQEFAAIVAAPAPLPRVDPWRRTSGLHRIRKPQALAIVRELWQTREALARSRDTAPGRLLPDSAIVEAAAAAPATRDALRDLPGFRGRGAQRFLREWHDAVARALALPKDQWPPSSLPPDGPPPARVWAERDKAAAARLSAARSAVAAIADEHVIPVENLLSPDSLRRLCWTPPWTNDAMASPQNARAMLEDLGARPWQCDLVVTAVCKAIVRASAASGSSATDPPADTDPEI